MINLCKQRMLHLAISAQPIGVKGFENNYAGPSKRRKKGVS